MKRCKISQLRLDKRITAIIEVFIAIVLSIRNPAKGNSVDIVALPKFGTEILEPSGNIKITANVTVATRAATAIRALMYSLFPEQSKGTDG